MVFPLKKPLISFTFLFLLISLFLGTLLLVGNSDLAKLILSFNSSIDLYQTNSSTTKGFALPVLTQSGSTLTTKPVLCISETFQALLGNRICEGPLCNKGGDKDLSSFFNKNTADEINTEQEKDSEETLFQMSENMTSAITKFISECKVDEFKETRLTCFSSSQYLESYSFADCSFITICSSSSDFKEQFIGKQVEVEQISISTRQLLEASSQTVRKLSDDDDEDDDDSEDDDDDDTDDDDTDTDTNSTQAKSGNSNANPPVRNPPANSNSTQEENLEEEQELRGENEVFEVEFLEENIENSEDNVVEVFLIEEEEIIPQKTEETFYEEEQAESFQSVEAILEEVVLIEDIEEVSETVFIYDEAEVLLEEDFVEEEENFIFVVSQIPIHKDDNDCQNADFYLFPNKSCGPTCPFETYIIQDDPSSERTLCTPCHSTCLTCTGKPENCTACNSAFPYLYPNNSCLSTCSMTIIDLGDYKVCTETQTLDVEPETLTASLDEYLEISEIFTTVSLAGLHMFHAGATSTAPKILLINLIQYVKYLEINYPPKVASMFRNEMGDLVSFDFDFGFPNSLKDEANMYDAEPRFQDFNVNGLFLVNFWGEGLTAVCLILTSCLVMLLSKLKLKNNVIIRIISWAKDFLLWNFMFSFFVSLTADVTFFAIIEMQNLQINNGLTVASFIVMIIFIIISYYIFLYIPFKIRQIRRRVHNSDNPDQSNQYQKIRVLFEDVKAKYFIQEAFIFIISLQAILNVIIFAAFNSPTLQCVLSTLLTVVFIGYLVIYHPLKDNWQHAELIIYQLLSLIAFIICFCLSLMDFEDQYKAVGAEIALIVTNSLLALTMVLFTLLGLVTAAKEGLQRRKEKKKLQQVLPYSGPECKNSKDQDDEVRIKAPLPELEHRRLSTCSVETVETAASSKEPFVPTLGSLETIDHEEKPRSLNAE